jgi:hypothetical protein
MAVHDRTRLNGRLFSSADAHINAAEAAAALSALKEQNKTKRMAAAVSFCSPFNKAI